MDGLGGGHGHDHGHDHHDHDHHDHDHLRHHAHDDFVAATHASPSLLSSALWTFLKQHQLIVAAFVALFLLALVLLQRRRRAAQDSDTNYGAEKDMNVAIRRARAIEARQAEYDRKAKEYEELQARRKVLEAEERVRLAAAAALMGPVGGTGGGGSGGSGSGFGAVEFNPLMGSGPVGGFRSNRCVKRGG